MIVAGLTGNYGMGKSTVLKMFGELGAVTLNSDALVGELLQEPKVINEIIEAVGQDIVTGNSINKKMLADIVFASPSLRISLENILHPRVFKKIDEKISELSLSGSNVVVIIEVPLLYERGYQNRFDKTITVYTTEEAALQNLFKIGISEESARQRLKNQFPIEMKISKSDYSVDNGQGFDFTKEQVANIYLDLDSLAKGRTGAPWKSTFPGYPGMPGSVHGNN